MAGTKQKTTKPEAEASRGPKVSGSLPLYGEPQAINSITHRDVGVLVGPGDFQFAAKAPMIQLTVDEFERASLDYPIVFFGADRQAYAVTGLEAERNLFVAEGSYRPDAYVPAYLRRYPFVFAREEGSDTLLLCLDHGSDRVVEAGHPDAVALFEGNAPSALTRQALEFCENYEAAERRTRVLVDLLLEFELFEAKQAHYTAPGGTEATLLLEYLTIDRARLEALDPEQFLRLRTAGALPAIYAQIASQAKWEALVASNRSA